MHVYGERILTYYTRILLLGLTYGRTMFSVVVITSVAYQRRYSTSSPVSTGMGDPSQICRLRI